MDANSHSFESCKQQTLCGAGHKLVGASSTKKGSCEECGTGTYITSNSHRTTTCSTYSKCGAGQYQSGGSTSSNSVCKTCGAGKYEDRVSHSSRDCKDQTVSLLFANDYSKLSYCFANV